MAVDFNIVFHIDRLEPLIVIKLNDNSVSANAVFRGIFRIDYPNGDFQQNQDMQLPDISAPEGTVDYPLIIDPNTNSPLIGEYKVTYTVLNGEVLETEQKQFTLDWLEPEMNIENDSDAAFPVVRILDITDYSVTSYTREDLDRTLFGQLPSTSNASGESSSGTGTELILEDSSSNAYEGEYNPILLAEMRYTSTVWTYLSVYWKKEYSEDFIVYKIPTIIEIIQYIENFKESMDEYKGKNSIEYNELDQEFQGIIALYTYFTERSLFQFDLSPDAVINELLSRLNIDRDGYSFQAGPLVAFVINYPGAVIVDLSLESFTVRGTTFGKYSDGDVVPAHNNPNARFIDMGTKTILPTFDLPTASISGNPTNTILEVGTTLDVTLTASLNENDGGLATHYEIVAVIGAFEFSLLSSDTISIIISNVTLQTTPIAYKCIIDYAAGTVPQNDNLGNVIANTITAGSVESPNLSYRGLRAVFYGSVASKQTDSAGIRTLTKVLENVTSFTLSTGSVNTIFQIWLPTGLSLTSVIDLDALSAEIVGDYTSEALAVNDAGGNSIAGTLYTKTQNVAYTSNHRHQVTIS
jgi:hypothetical protein